MYGKLSSFIGALSSAGVADIGLQGLDANQFVGKVYLGTPQQELSVVFDTGSSIAYVYAQDNCCPSENLIYDWKQSSTWRKDISGKTFKQTYGNGEVEGYKATDVFCFSKK